MTRCDLPDSDLIAYSDGELRGARREYVEVHLRVCPSCRARLDEIHETTRLLQRATPLIDDPAGRARVKARLAAEAQRAPRHSLRLPMLMAAPILLVIALVVVSFTWTSSPTEAAVSLRSLVHRVDPGKSAPGPSSVLTRERLPGTSVPPPEITGITHATFPTVVVPRLAGDLTLTSFNLKRPDYAELRYAGPNQLIVELAETPANKSKTTTEDSDQLVVISGTQVLWHVNPYGQTDIIRAIWVRNGIEFRLDMLQAAGPGIPKPIAKQLIGQIIAAQDSPDG